MIATRSSSTPALTFDEDTHTYRVDGEVWPSVTTVMKGLINDYSGAPDSVLQAKAELGRAVHLACHLDDSGELDMESVHPLVDPYLRAWRKFLRDVNGTVVESERIVFHPHFKYAGTLDNIVRMNGDLWLVDKKTTASVMPSAGPQTAAYAMAYQADPKVPAEPLKRAVVLLRADATYLLRPFGNAGDAGVFLSCLNIYNWKARNRE